MSGKPNKSSFFIDFISRRIRQMVEPAETNVAPAKTILKNNFTFFKIVTSPLNEEIAITDYYYTHLGLIVNKIIAHFT